MNVRLRGCGVKHIKYNLTTCTLCFFFIPLWFFLSCHSVMVTGIEATGVALAILPLVVNQLDNYARGLEKIKTFRRYKWQLEDFSSGLSAQYAIMVNTLEHSLEGVVDDHDQRSDLIKNPRGAGWKDPAFQIRLIQKLDRDYDPFTGTVRALCRLLEDLSHKLGLETGDYCSVSQTWRYHSQDKVTKNTYMLPAGNINKSPQCPQVSENIQRSDIRRSIGQDRQNKPDLENDKRAIPTSRKVSEETSETKNKPQTIPRKEIPRKGSLWYYRKRSKMRKMSISRCPLRCPSAQQRVHG